MSLTKEGPGDVRVADVSHRDSFGVASIGGHRMVRPAADFSLQLAALLIGSACAAAPAISDFTKSKKEGLSWAMGATRQSCEAGSVCTAGC